MLPSGPRSTYRLPSTPQPSDRDFARQILSSIRSEIQRSREVRLATATMGCDGKPLIDPLDGTACNGDTATDSSSCGLVLYNTTTRSVVSSQVGRAFSGSGPECRATVVSRTVLAGDCSVTRAKLKARRRFVDSFGNWFGPDGQIVSVGHTPAQLGTDYVHEAFDFRTYDTGDPIRWRGYARLYLQKLSGPVASLNLGVTDRAQGLVWPSINDDASPTVLTNPKDVVGLDDATFGGTYTGADDRTWRVIIDGTGSPDTFKWCTVTSVPGTFPTASSFTTGVAITGEEQDLSLGVTVRFGALTGHANNDGWLGSSAPNNDALRYGVAVRGTRAVQTGCIPVNSNVLMTAECRCTFPNGTSTFGSPHDLTAAGSHALVVRDPDSLALLYRKELDRDVASLVWGDPPQKFSFSTNDEGLFFLHAYTIPVISVPGSPYPGHEFGSPDNRKVAVISVNPLTFEPTIDELVTLSPGASFVVATTLPP
jgi:hypothetical protein